jgi:hypothetical protein
VADNDKTVIESVVAQTPNTVTTAIKSGFKTSEFVLIGISILSAIGDAIVKYNSEHVEPTNWGMAAAAFAAGLYAIGRSLVKAKTGP